MAASPGNMYHKQALKKRPTSYLQPSSGSVSKADKCLKTEKDIPLNAQSPPSPKITDRSPTMRKFSQITLSSETSDVLHTDANGNAAVVGTPKQTRVRAKRHHQKAGKGNKVQKLHLAALSGNEAEVEKLLGKGVDVNSADSFGKTPLHNAILGKHVTIVDRLIKSGADVKCLDERGDTPLHAAVRVNSEAIVILLLNDSKSNANAKGFESYTPLHIAAQLDSVDICKQLVEHEGDICQTADDKMTPFGMAVSKGAQSVAEYFAEVVEKKQLNVESLISNADDEGSTLLHLAVDSGILPIVSLCLKLGSKVRQPKESDNSTAFHLACAQGSLEIAQLLAGADQEVCKAEILDDQGMVPLHRAALHNHVTVVSYLLDQGAPVDPRDLQGRTPLFLAASVGGTATVQLLMDRGADITLKDVELHSPLHVAIGQENSTMEALIKSPASKALVIDKDMTGYTPVHYAARSGYLQHISLFINRNKAAVQVPSDSLDTPLHIVARYGWLEIAERLLRKRNVRMINLQNNQGKTPLHYACHEGHEEVAQLLLMKGATIERDHHDRTPLHMAAVNGSDPCVKHILEAHPESLNALDKHQNTALNLAATSGHASMVSYLLSVKEQEILLNKYNQNVLDLAISSDKEDVAMAIIEHSRWKEVLDASVGGGVSQIQTLVDKMPDVAERVLDNCVEHDGDPSSKDFKITYNLRLIQGKQSTTSPLEHSLDALKTMAERRRENCLTHPVCYVLMNIKWKTFGWITFIINLLLYLAFLLPFTALAVYLKINICELCTYSFCNNENQIPVDESEWHDENNTCNTSNKTVVTLHYFVIVFASIHLIKEIMQLIRQRLKYLTSITNFIEWLIYISALVYVFPVCACKSHYKAEVAAFSLFFAWLNLVLYFRRFSYYGKYVIMLLTMFQTLFQVLFLFFLFVVAFGTTFFLLMYSEDFKTFEYGLLKTFAMTLGELNYESDFMLPNPEPHYPGAANVFFVMFCLAMPIILMNMLIGLAVGDIDKIQQKSVMARYVMQVELLLEIEESLPQWILRRVQVDKHEEFPNRKAKLQTRIYEKVIGFGKAESTGDDGVPPAMAQIIDKILEQDTKIDEIHQMLKGQAKLLKRTGRGEGEDEDSGPGNRKSIFGWFSRK